MDDDCRRHFKCEPSPPTCPDISWLQLTRALCVPGLYRRQYRMVARVCCLEEPDRVLCRTLAYHTDYGYVVRAHFSTTKATSYNPLPSAFGTKTVSDVHHCAHSCRRPQFLFSPGVFANTFTSLSLATNLIATALIGYKTWYVAQPPETLRSYG